MRKRTLGFHLVIASLLHIMREIQQEALDMIRQIHRWVSKDPGIPCPLA